MPLPKNLDDATISDLVEASVELASDRVLDTEACIRCLISGSEVELTERLDEPDMGTLVEAIHRYLTREHPDADIITVQFTRTHVVIGKQFSIRQFLTTFIDDLRIGAENSWSASKDLNDLSAWMLSLLIQLRHASDRLEFPSGFHDSFIRFLSAATQVGLDDYKRLCDLLQRIAGSFYFA